MLTTRPRMLPKLIAFVVPLSLDTFAVSAALGAAGLPAGRQLRVSLLMAAFEAGMPLLGVALGAPLGRTIGTGADLLAVAMLIALGGYMLYTDRDETEEVARLGEAGGFSAVALGVSISLDELAVGFTLGLVRLPIAAVVLAIGAQAFLVSQLGMRLGSRLNSGLREGAERLAGLALIALGVGVLAVKLL